MMGLVKLLRPYYSLTFPLTIIVIIYYAMDGQMHGLWLEAILATVSLSLVLMGAYALNDYFDIVPDKNNNAKRPIALGELDPRVAFFLGALLTMIGLLASFFCGWKYILLLCAVAIALLFYNKFSKRMGILKPVTVGLLMISMYPLSLAITDGVPSSRGWSLFFFPFWMFMISFSFEMYKDLRDVKGDVSVTGAPILWQKNPRRWRFIANIVHICGGLTLLLTFAFGNSMLYLLLVSPAILLPFLSFRAYGKSAMWLIAIEYIFVGIAAVSEVMLY